jgi:hypothetical protein
MSALPAERRRRVLLGSAKPRLAPPRPLRSTLPALEAEAACLGIVFMPWQQTAGRYIEAVDKDGKRLFAEVPVVVGRQNGKTEMLTPIIARRLRMGRKLMHTAQDRQGIVRDVFLRVADHMVDKHPYELAGKPRLANGLEEIRTKRGGRYRIVAPSRGGARGPANDDLLIDEVREFKDWDFIGAAKPTVSASPDPQIIYLTSEGEDDSVVLNSLRARSGEDRSLAFLDWSAPPDLAPDDLKGWLASNPAIGHLPGKLANLEREYQAHLLGGTLHIWETEYLCRHVVKLSRPYVDLDAWADQPLADMPPTRVAQGVSMDATGERASAVLAWRNRDESVSLSVVADVTGSPIDVDRLGPDLRQLAAERRVTQVAYDPWTDVDLARFLPRARALNGRDYANASVTFARLVDERKLRMDDETKATIGRDLARLTRRTAQGGAFMAVRANELEMVTAALAAIRAVALVATPSSSIARIH